MTEIFQSEIIISEISNLLKDDKHVAIGAASPIPGSAALLAQEERKNTNSKLQVTILHSQKFNNFKCRAISHLMFWNIYYLLA